MHQQKLVDFLRHLCYITETHWWYSCGPNGSPVTYSTATSDPFTMYRMYYNLPIKVSVTYHTLQWLLLLAFTAQRVKLATIHCQWLVKENLAQITSTFTDNYHQHGDTCSWSSSTASGMSRNPAVAIPITGRGITQICCKHENQYSRSKSGNITGNEAEQTSKLRQ